MQNDELSRGSFTLPGEAGWEKLTKELAEKWGADTIRDSDGTRLSDDLLRSGFDIYSTLCLVRADNAWARANPDKLQQNFLMSRPVVARGPTVRIDLLDGYFRDQFVVDVDDDHREFWQVFDRTTGREVPASRWSFDAASGAGHHPARDALAPVHRQLPGLSDLGRDLHVQPPHNDWGERERLMAVEPRHPEITGAPARGPGAVARGAPGDEGGAVHVAVLQLRLVLGRSPAASHRLLRLGFLRLHRESRGPARLREG